jgi:DHA1 family multidrug resistance protein-like MFS transporter
MYVRALFFATATTLIAAFATEPWHVAVAYSCQGLLSGFIPAAVALTSVTVPDSRLNSSLGIVTAAQYLGNTVGPAVGSGLAWSFGRRGAIVAAAVMPAVVALIVFVVVPRDEVMARSEARKPGEPRPAAIKWWRLVTLQFALAIFLYFFLFAANQLIRTLTPVAIEEIEGHRVTGVVGLAFTLSGVASVAGVTIVARKFVRQGQLPAAIATGCVIAGMAHVLLAFSGTVPVYVVAFCVIAAVQGALLPASNTLIAANVPRERRGTAFGLAGSAQALAFMAGPLGATACAAVSITWGYVLLGVLFVGMALLARGAIREPHPSGADESVTP